MPAFRRRHPGRRKAAIRDPATFDTPARSCAGMTSKIEFPLALDEAALMDEPTKLHLVGKSLHHNAAPADRRVNPDALICARIEATT